MCSAFHNTEDQINYYHTVLDQFRPNALMRDLACVTPQFRFTGLIRSENNKNSFSGPFSSGVRVNCDELDNTDATLGKVNCERRDK
jgi:hypothetical protein